MKINYEDKIARLLEATYSDIHEPTEEGFSDKQHDFVFHMRDWQKNLDALAALYADPDRHTPEDAKRVVRAFLLHATGHIVAAARLYDVVLDPFGPKTDHTE